MFHIEIDLIRKPGCACQFFRKDGDRHKGFLQDSVLSDWRQHPLATRDHVVGYFNQKHIDTENQDKILPRLDFAY